MKTKALIIGCSGQIGSELTVKLAEKLGAENVIASDIKAPLSDVCANVKFEILDAKNFEAVKKVVVENQITDVYLLAAMLSAVAEKNVQAAWDLNMQSLFNVLNLAKEKYINKIFWPSSIAVFGPKTPLDNTPQYTIMDPNTVYGISKLTGELWCNYYFEKYGVDVRSVRFPGLISWKAEPGGGTTDYAIDIFYKALKSNKYECFLSENTYLPMLYMPDALEAIINIMDAPKEKIKIRTSYSLAGISFSPKELYQVIKKYVPDFKIEYQPDFRQKIADTWPNSMDEKQAREDWGWNFKYDIEQMSEDMIKNLKIKLGV